MRSPRRLTAVAALLATAFAGTPALLSSAGAAPAAAEDRAVSRAADRYGVDADALQERLRSDPNFRITPSGAAYNLDPAVTGKTTPPRMLAQAFPLPDTFLLHSKPGAQRTIYLDFDGHNVTNTAWNGPAGGNVPNGSHPPMDLGGNGAAFSDAEKLQIQDIYQRVAEDFAPFDVDVTTQEPSAAALDRTNAGDLTYGVRALISPSTSAAAAICDSNCGGVAFVGVFSHFAGNGSDPTPHEQYQPAWVFPQLLTGGNQVKNIAEATTHEVGHNLGLDHDSFDGQDNYYGGHDSWAPIMGGAYSKPISQFSPGGYPGASLGSAQSNPDDLVTIGAFLSPAASDLRADEPGTTIASAGALPTGSAYITTRTDVDYFALGTCAGTVTVNANGAEVSPNLDIEAQLLNSSGTVIDTDNPGSAFSTLDVASGMDASAQGTSLPSGQYYARIDGIGRGTQMAAYDDYGSIGAYTLQVTGCDGVVDPGEDVPSAPQNLAGLYLGENAVQLTWTAPADDGGSPITAYHVYEDGTLIGEAPGDSTGGVVDNVSSGVHTYGVAAVNSEGEGPKATVQVDATDTEEAKPGKPRIGTATPGKRGGKLTANVGWQPPSGTTNPAIDGYRVVAYRENRHGKFVKFSTSPVLGGDTGSIVFTTNTRARLRFAVQARNDLGFGSLSSKSNAVRPR